jgi:Flp pilus assembly pilin Flp
VFFGGAQEMKAAFKRFVRDERGIETVEYAVMMALIVAALVTTMTLLLGAISNCFGSVQGTIDA